MGSDTRQILIIEDVDLLRDVLSMHFDSLGYETTSAQNGAEALELMKKQKIDIVMSDIQMPVLDGMTFVTKVREMEKGTDHHTTIMLITGYADYSVRDALEKGADGIFFKPLSGKEMNAGISLLLQNSHDIQKSIISAEFQCSKKSIEGALLQVSPRGIFLSVPKSFLPEISQNREILISSLIHESKAPLPLKLSGTIKWVHLDHSRENLNLGIELSSNKDVAYTLMMEFLKQAGMGSLIHEKSA